MTCVDNKGKMNPTRVHFLILVWECKTALSHYTIQCKAALFHYISGSLLDLHMHTHLYTARLAHNTNWTPLLPQLGEPLLVGLGNGSHTSKESTKKFQNDMSERVDWVFWISLNWRRHWNKPVCYWIKRVKNVEHLTTRRHLFSYVFFTPIVFPFP